MFPDRREFASLVQQVQVRAGEIQYWPNRPRIHVDEFSARRALYWASAVHVQLGAHDWVEAAARRICEQLAAKEIQELEEADKA